MLEKHAKALWGFLEEVYMQTTHALCSVPANCTGVLLCLITVRRRLFISFFLIIFVEDINFTDI